MPNNPAQYTQASRSVTAVNKLLPSCTRGDSVINYEKPIGNGTDESPYKVTSVAELSYLREEPGATYILANNIDLSDVRWNPFFFCGKLDGLNNSITGIKVADNAHNSGLFSKLIVKLIGCRGLSVKSIPLSETDIVSLSPLRFILKYLGR